MSPNLACSAEDTAGVENLHGSSNPVGTTGKTL